MSEQDTPLPTLSMTLTVLSGNWQDLQDLIYDAEREIERAAERGESLHWNDESGSARGTLDLKFTPPTERIRP